MGDAELLQKFADPGSKSSSEAAFRMLVERYAGLVFSIALRRVGDPQLAEEIAQNVFTVLARKASKIDVKGSLAGWLHQAAMLESAKALRGEQRRQRKMKAFHDLEERSEHEGTPRWSQVLPLLDEALHRLSSKDRDLVLQHYFEERTYEEIAIATGRTKAACAKQGSRVLVKLCRMLKRKGVTISGAALGAGITTHLAKGAPAGLTHSLSQVALNATASMAANTTLLTIMTTTKFTTAALLMVTGAALPLSFQWAIVTPTKEMASDPNAHRAVTQSASSNPALPLGDESIVTTQRLDSGINLHLLERELRRLPFPEGDVKRQLDLERLMFQLSENEVPRVVAMVMRLDPEHLGKITSALFARWGEFAPEAAARVAEEMEDKGLIYHAREGVMGAWAATDPASALKYLEKHPDGSKSSNIVWATIGDMVDRDPFTALSLVSEVIADEKVGRNVREIILEAWGEADPDAAMAWAGTYDEIQARSYSKAILRRLASADPARAFQLALETEHPSIRVGSARWTLMQWMGQDPLAAAKAYVSMPPEFFDDEQILRTSVMLSGEVAKRAPDKALSMVDQLPEGPVRNQWLYGIAWELASSTPEQAVPLAESLPPSGNRSRALQYIGKQWLSQDAESATAWIEQSGNFDQKAMAELLNR